MIRFKNYPIDNVVYDVIGIEKVMSETIAGLSGEIFDTTSSFVER